MITEDMARKCYRIVADLASIWQRLGERMQSVLVISDSKPQIIALSREYRIVLEKISGNVVTCQDFVCSLQIHSNREGPKIRFLKIFTYLNF